jgi:O-acetylhomoserine/O-acetylserine sulfhydrylase-like pyridoxal-dependent enzyme
MVLANKSVRFKIVADVKNMKPDKSFFIKVVHAGEDLTKHYRAVFVPIDNATIFSFTNSNEGATIHNYQKEGSTRLQKVK